MVRRWTPKKRRRAKRVRGREDHSTESLQGRERTIGERWGHVGYCALDFLFDEVHWQLFWHHELEEADEGG
jgi:hypothetical protein